MEAIKRRLGKAGPEVPAIGLGCMVLSGTYGPAEEKESLATLDRALELGCNFWDTADVYGRGHNEQLVGRALKGRRERVVLATKCGFVWTKTKDEARIDGSPQHIRAACEASLQRLLVEAIDLYYLHNWDRFTPVEETMSALEDLVRTGKVRYVGFSDAPAWKVAQAQVIAQFRGWAPLIALQIEYSLLQRTVEGELIPMAQELGLGVLPWSPLKGGILSGKYTRENRQTTQEHRGASIELTDKDYTIIDQIQKIASELDTDVSTVARCLSTTVE